MKILFLTPKFAPHIGGVEKHLSEVVNILSKQHQITVVTEQYDRSLPLFEEKRNLQIYRILSAQNQSQKFVIWNWLLKHLHLFLTADVIHVHDVFYWVLPFRFLFFWKRFYITFHGYEAPGPLTAWQVRWHRIAAALTKGNICVGDFHASVYGIKPTLVTYGGVGAVAEERKPAKKKKKPLQILFVGRIANDTGVKTYFSALKNLNSKIKYKADFYGDGPLRSQLQKEARLQKLPISFPGSVVNPSNLYSAADLVFASQYLGILQALSADKPVIAVADTPLKRTYLGQTPFAKWIVIADNEAGVSMAVIQQGRANAPIPRLAQNWIGQQTWQNVARKYLELWAI